MKVLNSLLLVSLVILNSHIVEAKSKTPPPRKLKKLVEIGQVTASPFNTPAGGKFDFQFVANAQMYDVITKNTNFAINFVQPVASPLASPHAEGDRKLLSTWQKSGRDLTYASYTTDSICMMYTPMAKISGIVTSFEAKSESGFSIGYSPGGSHNPGLDLNFKLKKADLEFIGVALAPMPVVNTSTTYATARTTATHKEGSSGFNINFGVFRLGFQHYFNSPFAKVTNEALVKAMDELNKGLEYMPWFTRVIYNHDTHLVITGGRNLGVKVGDQFNVFNEDHYWQGEPCNSLYIDGLKSKDPTAVIEIESVGQDISRGRVIQQDPNYNVKLGSKVEILKLVP